MAVLVTGAAGFIGYHVAAALLARGQRVVGVDNLNAYYDPRLKQARLARLRALPEFAFERIDIADRAAVARLVRRYPGITQIVHLAAQAGVRYSLEDPYVFATTNVLGQICLLEAARALPKLQHFVYASSSSVYGGNTGMPFAEMDRVDQPLSVYAATKRAAELISASYAHLHGLPQTGLRFFTAYGPWGRPDMAYYQFAAAIVAGQPIDLFNGGALRRDFTYVDDVVTAVLASLDQPPAAGEGARILNIGNCRSESVSDLVDLLEQNLGRRAIRRSTQRPQTEVGETLANGETAAEVLGFRPTTTLAAGIAKFVEWFRGYTVSDAVLPSNPLDHATGRP